MDLPILLSALYIAVGEIIDCGVLGELLATALLKRKSIFGGKADNNGK